MLYDGGDGFLSGFAAFCSRTMSRSRSSPSRWASRSAVPTALLMLFNGCMLGAFFEVYWSQGLGFELGGWLCIHGMTELFAITLAGAAGMRIGWRSPFPAS